MTPLGSVGCKTSTQTNNKRGLLILGANSFCSRLEQKGLDVNIVSWEVTLHLPSLLKGVYLFREQILSSVDLFRRDDAQESTKAVFFV